MLECGDTFLTGDGDEENYHLWVVVTSTTEGEVVTVCLVTAHKRTERLVMLQPGDHPFVKHESAISYAFSKIRTVEDVEALIANGSARKKDPMPPETLRRIQSGLVDSDFTPNGVRAFFRAVTD